MAVRTTPLYDLSGPTFASAFQEGQTTQSSLETAEAQRQRALEQSIRAEKELAMRQAQEARRAQAAKRAAATSAEILRRLGAGAQGPSTTAPTTPGVRTSTAQLPQTQIIPERYFQDPGSVQEYAGSPPSAQPQPTVTPGIQSPGQVRAPGISVGPTPGTPSGAAPQPSGLAPAPVAPLGGGSSAGVPSQPSAGAPPGASGARVVTTMTFDKNGRMVIQEHTYDKDGNLVSSTVPPDDVRIEKIDRPPGMMPLGAGVSGPADTDTRASISPAAPAAAASDPIANAKWAAGAYLSRKPLVPITGKSPRARALQVNKNARTIADSIDASTISARAMGSATWGKRQPPERVNALRAYSATQKKAAEWFRSREGRSVFAKNPDLFADAEQDPVAFYEKYKGGASAAPSVPAGVTISPTQPEAAARDSKAEFLPTLVTQGLKVGPSAAETALRTPADKVAPVPIATLLNAERRKRDLQQFDRGINQLRQQAATLARSGKNAQAMGIMAKMNALRAERARFANLVNLAEFEISGDVNIIDQIARSGGAAIRIGPTNDPLTFAVFRTAPDGTQARAGTITKDQLVKEYKMFYDQKYATLKQKEAEDARKRALDLQEFTSKEQAKSTIRALEKARGDGEPTFRQDASGLTTVIVRGRPVYAYEIQQVEVNGAITYRLKRYVF